MGLLEDIEEIISTADPVIKLAWNNAEYFERLSPFIIGSKELFDLTDQQLDQIFDVASKIEF
jgi:hypothetical protein